METMPFPIPDLAGKTAVVTGASGGIGASVSRTLAASGARVVFAVRDTARGRQVAGRVPGKTGVLPLDLADLSSVRAFAEAWNGPIDLLINNAGVYAQTLKRTRDGFELQFGTNHLGHFALTNLLWPHLTGRVVTVASMAERSARLDFSDLNWARTPYRAARAYNNSKLANLLFSAALQRRFTAAGSRVLAVAAHPGLVKTNIYAGYESAVGNLMVRLLAQDADHGALPVLYAAVGDVPGDSFTGPEHMAHMRGGAQLINRSKTARDTDVAERLWSASEDLTGVKSPIFAKHRPTSPR
jgi:NAD(P)-dependent dehydrogenase (short-subunit alcohol dehydrogenase family)